MNPFDFLTRPFKRKAAQDVIAIVLTDLTRAGMFTEDAKTAARNVVNLRPLIPQMYTVNARVLAAMLLGRYVLEEEATHEVLSPYALASSNALKEAHSMLGPRGPNRYDEWGMEMSLKMLEWFYERSPINLAVQQPSDAVQFSGQAVTGTERLVVPITDAPSSMVCIMAENAYLNAAYGGDGGWVLELRWTVEESGRAFDVFKVNVRGQGAKTIWFDITDSKALWTEQGDLEALAQLSTALDAAKGDR